MVCVKRFGFLDEVTAYLKEASMKVRIFWGIEPDLSVETVVCGAETMTNLSLTGIVTIGDVTKKQFFHICDITIRI